MEVKPKKSNQRAEIVEPYKLRTFASQKKLLNEYYNWNVEFPSTTIHHNSILYRDAAQNQSFRNKLKIMSEKIMTMGGRGHLGNDFGGSNKELSPRKVQNGRFLLENKLAKSEISLNQIKDDPSATKLSSSLLNMIAIPFNWKSRLLTNKNNASIKKKPNMLTNFWRKKRIGNAGLACNKR